MHVEGGHDDLANFSLTHRIARTRPHDFEDHVFIDDHSFARRCFICNDTHIGRGVALIGRDAFGREEFAQAWCECAT
jgi:hypothetical protein